jgi:transcription-repair coupling factor (superfamily II helicase)
VYFVHNRVDTIYSRAASIQELVPNCRIGVGHGQMGETELERVLLGFMRHDYDVFVCTTIVENGIDIPLANTIIIENAERYGLSELYQLRGRVGRSNRRAYAYLLVPQDTELSEVARKRLAALREFSDLGAGFKIAASIGAARRGQPWRRAAWPHLAVGFDMYLRLPKRQCRSLKANRCRCKSTPLNLGLDIRIPPEYIADEHSACARINTSPTRAMRNRRKSWRGTRGPLPARARAVGTSSNSPAEGPGREPGRGHRSTRGRCRSFIPARRSSRRS